MSLRSFFIASAALLITAPAFAHHGWGGQAAATSEITGTIVQDVSLAGPHATMKINVDGKVWDVTLAPPFRTQEAGLKAGIIPMGAMVTIHGNRSMTANRLEMKTSKVKWGQKTFDVYPERD